MKSSRRGAVHVAMVAGARQLPTISQKVEFSQGSWGAMGLPGAALGCLGLLRAAWGCLSKRLPTWSAAANGAAEDNIYSCELDVHSSITAYRFALKLI